MKETPDFPLDPDKNESLLIERFEQMLLQGKQLFFDVDEFEELIEYYSIRNITKNAFIAINMAKSQHPTSYNFMLKEAELLAYSNKPVEALKTIEKLESIEGKNADTTLTKASIFSFQGRYHQAIKTLKDALSFSDTDKENIYMSLAFEYQNINKLNQAIKCLKTVLAINPQNEDAVYEIAYCYDISNQPNKAVEFFTDWIDEYPYNYHLWYNLGNAYTALQQYSKAIEAYDFAIVINDAFSSAYFNKANILARIENYEEAIDVYKDCLKLEKGGAITHFYLAECYYNTENYQNALTHYSKATEADAKYVDAWLGMGLCVDNLFSVKEALPYFEKAYYLEEHNIDAMLTLGEAYSRLGKKHLATAMYKAATEQDHAEPEIFIEVADFFLEEEIAEEAILTLLDGIRRNPDETDLMIKLAAVYLQYGNPAKGLQHLEEALSLHPEKYPLIFEFYADAEKNQNVIDLIETYKN